MGTTTTHLHCTTMSARDAARFSLCATPIAARSPFPFPFPARPAWGTRHPNQCASAGCELPKSVQCEREMRRDGGHRFVDCCVALRSISLAPSSWPRPRRRPAMGFALPRAMRNRRHPTLSSAFATLFFFHPPIHPHSFPKIGTTLL